MRQPKYLSKANRPVLMERAAKVILQCIGLFVSLLTAFLYLLGQIHNDSYFRAWGIPPSLFLLSREQSIISGLIRSSILGAKALVGVQYLLVAWLAIVVIAMACLFKPIANALREFPSRKGGEIRQWLNRHFLRSSIVGKLVDATGVAYSGYVFLVIIFLLFVFSCASVEREAVKQVKREKESILAGAKKSLESPGRANIIIREAKGFNQYSGYLIASSSTHCALYDRTRGVTVLPLNGMSRLIIKKE